MKAVDFRSPPGIQQPADCKLPPVSEAQLAAKKLGASRSRRRRRRRKFIYLKGCLPERASAHQRWLPYTQ